MKYDVAIIGGGIAGLSLSIDLRKRGYKIIVIEKGNYPRHKVCGEYISNESKNYLQSICPVLSSLNLPAIDHFKLTSGNNKEFSIRLAMGGFGISRYLLEDLLFKEAEKQGVDFKLNIKARSVDHTADDKSYSILTDSGNVTATLVCNSTGKNSNLKSSERITTSSAANYVGVKYHIKLARNQNRIEIHNFPGGYCGISNIEEEKSCLCYIVNAKNLNSVRNSIPELEKIFLFKNAHLKNIFASAEFIFEKPLTISGINFLIKEPVTDDAFFLGDAAGRVAPIAGNGMSMGLRAASMLAETIDQFFSEKISKQQLSSNYTRSWDKAFSKRIKLSRHLQKLSEYSFLTKRTIELFNFFPALARGVIA
ncbi:MAG: NAD(P)/FAD-dependent oxidoreductase, partial [Bacteroidia bacterium]|nr:NAD(P)/FAD-dependent oxidoreductase [Bacteroidia bacterium]